MTNSVKAAKEHLREVEKRLRCVEKVVGRLPVGVEIIRVELTEHIDKSFFNGATYCGERKPFAEIHLSKGIDVAAGQSKHHKLCLVENWSDEFDMKFYIDNGVALFELVARGGVNDE